MTRHQLQTIHRLPYWKRGIVCRWPEESSCPRRSWAKTGMRTREDGTKLSPKSRKAGVDCTRDGFAVPRKLCNGSTSSLSCLVSSAGASSAVFNHVRAHLELTILCMPSDSLAALLFFVIPRVPSLELSVDAPLSSNNRNITFTRVPALFNWNAQLNVAIDGRSNWIPVSLVVTVL